MWPQQYHYLCYTGEITLCYYVHLLHLNYGVTIPLSTMYVHVYVLLQNIKFLRASYIL